MGTGAVQPVQESIRSLRCQMGCQKAPEGRCGGGGKFLVYVVLSYSFLLLIPAEHVVAIPATLNQIKRTVC
jgi:hypothetical protein